MRKRVTKIGRKSDEIKVLKNRLEYAGRRIEQLRRDSLGYSEMQLAMNAVIYSVARRYGQARYENGRLTGWHLEIERPDVSKVQQESVSIRKVGNEWYIGVLSAEGAEGTAEGEAMPEGSAGEAEGAGIQAASGGAPDEGEKQDGEGVRTAGEGAAVSEGEAPPESAAGAAALRSGAEKELQQAAQGAKGGEAG